MNNFLLLLPLEEQQTKSIRPQRSDEFLPNSRFQDVVALYVFDKKLCLLILDAIERIEVAFRVDIAYLHYSDEIAMMLNVTSEYQKISHNYEEKIKKISQQQEVKLKFYLSKINIPFLNGIQDLDLWNNLLIHPEKAFISTSKVLFLMLKYVKLHLILLHKFIGRELYFMQKLINYFGMLINTN